MKRLFFTVFLSIICLIFSNEKSFAANELFRSAASGNWNSNSTWEMSVDGFNWVPATSTPNELSSTITVRSPNVVTVTADVSADQLIVNTGATLSVSSLITLTIIDGPGDDLTLNPGGTISGSGTLRTQGTDLYLLIQNGSNLNVSLKINSGMTTAYDGGSPFTAVLKGAVTVDTGATLSARTGGYYLNAMNAVTNNGTITAGNATVIIRGATLINNGTINPFTLNFDSTTALSGAGAFTGSYINIGSSGNVSLSGNVTVSPAFFTVNSGGTLNPNGLIFTQNSGTFTCNSGGNVTSSGTFRTQGTVLLVPKAGSNFNGTLKVNTGTTSAEDNSSPYVAYFKGTITVDAGATFTVVANGYFIQASGNVTNSGTITTGSGSTFIMRGPTLTNTGTITGSNLNFDSTTTVTGNGSYSSNIITIGGTGIVSQVGPITFSPGTSFTINGGGVFNPNGENFTFTSGSFVLNNGAVVSGTGVNAGQLRSQNNVNFIFRNGSTFNSRLRVLTGTLTAYNDGSPYKAIYYGNIIVDAGATLTVLGGGYVSQANGTVTNNGTITSGNSSTYIIRGTSLVNNGVINPTNLNFDSTTSVSGTGSFSAFNININSTGNVSLAGNVAFSPGQYFTINGGGILNPNSRTFTFNAGSFILNSGGTVSNSGVFQCQGSVNLYPRAGSNFNGLLKVNTGTATASDFGFPYTALFSGTITVDAGAILSVPGGGYLIRSNGNVTNNGTITSGGGSTFIMRGASLTNSGVINPTNFNFDTTTAISGTGSFSGNINIDGSGNVALGSNVTFSNSNLIINAGGILNPNLKIFTINGGSFTINSGGTTSNSGIFQTQTGVNMNIRAGSSFNSPLKVNTGTANSYDGGFPYEAVFNGPITIDTGAVFSVQGGGYFIRSNGNVTNNGTLGGGSTFKFAGSDLTNNGTVNVATFNFESGAHTLQGTGNWATNANVLSGSTVTLASDHKMSSISINSGGTFNVSAFVLFVTASNPIGNSGTFNTSTGTVEYNGTSLQGISTSNITYRNLRINNAAGTSLSGNVTVTATLSDLLGHLNLNGFILTISSTGLLSETPGNTVNGSSGYITTTRNLNAPASMNVGGLGAVLTTGANLGSTEIRRGHTVQNGLTGNTSIQRYFDITPTNNSGLNGTLVYRFDDSELNGKVEAALSLFRSTNSGVSWTAQGGTVNTSNNSITLSGIDAFSRWSATSPNSAASQLTAVLQGFYNLSTGRLNMRDTVRAYLRTNSSPYNVIDSAKSVIDSVTFTGSYLFSNAPTGTYYIQLKHRNSIETWSKSPGVSYTLGTPLIYDFTTGAGQAYGNNLIQKGSKFCVYSGDVNQDGVVDAVDVSSVDNAVFNFLSGYIVTDVNGDRIADAQDLSISDNNAFNFVGKITPP